MTFDNENCAGYNVKIQVFSVDVHFQKHNSNYWVYHQSLFIHVFQKYKFAEKNYLLYWTYIMIRDTTKEGNKKLRFKNVLDLK